VELGALLRAEQQGTAVALARAGRPSLTWLLPRVDEGSVGQLLVALETQTALQAELLGVNAYDQPGVEAGKLAAFALIGREGFERERQALEADQPPRWEV
jgi:glucose-6-phosphate isomerase